MSLMSTGDEGRHTRKRGVLGPQWDHHDAFTVEELGQILGLSRPTAFKMVARGDIPALRVGKRLIIRRRTIERLLSEPEVA